MWAALTSVVQLVGCCPAKPNVTGLIPGQGTCLAVGSVPSLGGTRGNQLMFLSHTDASLPLFLLLFPFL